MAGLSTGRRRRLGRELEELRLDLVRAEAVREYLKAAGANEGTRVTATSTAAVLTGKIARLEEELGIRVPAGATVADLGRVIDEWAGGPVNAGFGQQLARHLKSRGWVKLDG